MALEGVLAGASEAYLVGDEDDGGAGGVGETVEVGLGGGEGLFGVLGVEEEVGEPEGDAVDEDYAAFKVVAAECALLLDVGPLRASALLVQGHAAAELVVPDMGGGDVDRGGGEGERPALGLFALS